MKNIILPILIFISAKASTQVIIGDDKGTTANKTSVLLEFAKTQNKGIILPYIKTLPTNPAEGTIILDATNPADARVKYFNGQWTDLSIITEDADKGNVTAHLAQQPATPVANTNAKVIIGSNTSDADGVLVLESTTKAMVLPTVNSTDDIINPAPGMMVYVSNKETNEKLFAIFNGTSWSFLTE